MSVTQRRAWSTVVGAAMFGLSLPSVIAATASPVAAAQLPSARAMGGGSGVSPFHAADVALVNQYVSEISSKLGGIKLQPSITVVESSSTYGPDNSNADTLCTGPGGDGDVPVTECTIRVFMSARSSKSDTTDQSAKIHVALAHESFHMFQYQMAGSTSKLDALGTWLIEGSAAWVQTVLVNDPIDYASFWTKWLNSPTVPLFSRTYTAIGFFAHMASTGISPWSEFPAIFAATSPQAAYNVAVGSSEAFLDNWASLYFRNSGWGDEWDQDSQNSGFADVNVPSKAAVGYSVPDVPGPAIGQKPLKLTVVPYAAGVWSVSLNSPISTITVVKGSVRLHSYNNNDLDEVATGSQMFCSASNPTDCAMCNQPSTLPKLTDVAVAATGGSTGAEVDITTTNPTSTTCPTTPPNSGSPGGGSPGYSEGDPHLSTFNGGGYDFQGAGEFTLVQSSLGGLDVQVREQPQKFSHFAEDVSWNTAVAMLVGSNKVEIDPGSPVVVLLNGRRVRGSSRHSLPSLELRGGGSVSVKSVTDGDQATITWPNGSRAEVFADELGENVSFWPSAAVLPHLSGLLDAWINPTANSGIGTSTSTTTTSTATTSTTSTSTSTPSTSTSTSTTTPKVATGSSPSTTSTSSSTTTTSTPTSTSSSAAPGATAGTSTTTSSSTTPSTTTTTVGSSTSSTSGGGGGPGSEVLLGGGGREYTINPTTETGFRALYGPFANSWRISNAQSLFTYARGKSTATYTVHDFPQRLLTIYSFSAKVRSQAQSDCRNAGIAKGSLFTDCVLDEEETGLRLAATVTAWTQKAVAEAAPAKAGWGKDVSVDKQKEGFGPGIAQHAANFSAVSCPTTTFCAAVDDVGDAFIYNGSQWASPIRIDKKLTYPDTESMGAVSCPTATFCVAGDNLDNVFVYNGTTWSKADNLIPSNSSNTSASVSFSVSCPTVSFCMATDGNNNWFAYNGTSWSAAKVIDPETLNTLLIGEVSCSSSTFCVAAYDTNTVTFNGTSWSAPIPIASKSDLESQSAPDLRAISCVSPRFCAGGGATNNNKAYFATFNGTSWSAPVIKTSEGGPQSISGLSCPTTTFCMAPGLLGWVTWGGTSWSSVNTFSFVGSDVVGGPQFANAVSCSSATFCVEVESNGLANIWK